MSADVLLAYLHGDDVATSFHGSLLDLISHDAGHDRRLAQWAKVECSSGGIPEGRNQATEQFVDSGCEWLLFLDTDMGYRGDILDQLLAAADPVERPIVGGLAFAARKTGPDGRNGSIVVPQPTIFDFVDHEDGYGPRLTGRAHYAPNTLSRCAGTGAAVLLIHRSVIERMADEFGPTWWDRIRGADGKLMGEDISFFVRVNALELPVFVHTGAKTTHAKTVWLGEPDYWRTITPPPASEPCAVIVPVYRRRGRAGPFMRSVVASTGLAVCYAVCDDDNDAAEWAEAGAVTIRIDEPSFAAKANAGYRATAEPWLLFVGDDVRFHAGWLDHVQWVADRYDRHVIATNDLATQRVIEGAHATHPVIRRSYIDELGASWDGPGTVAHEGYRHWYVDDEWTTVAKQRNAFTAAPGAIVEHLHPIAGKGETDDVYRYGERHAKQDRKLFEARLAETLT